jgi:DNA processing protein
MFGLVDRARREQAAVLALVSRARNEWHTIAQLIEATGSALRVVHRDWTGLEPPELLATAEHTEVTEAELDSLEAQIDGLANEAIWLITVLDNDYPTNLRRVYNRPPFLFVRGDLYMPDDERAVAVVGTRQASPDGIKQAARLARELVENNVTVLSGLALGIDTAAHTSTLDAGGRAIAVIGHGIKTPLYPAKNRELAERIVSHGGTLVSQFWPEAPPTRFSFPMRNVVMSGMAIGTVVIEASKTSGAKMQARLALEHGKRLFLVKSLVMQEPWAREYAKRPGATVVESVGDVMAALESELRSVEQLTLS